MNKYLIISVIVMAIFTYLPRMLPLTFFRKEIKSVFIKSILYYVPYAVLSALTFPSILYATNNIYTAIAGSIVALILAYYNSGLTIVALFAVLTSLIAGLFL